MLCERIIGMGFNQRRNLTAISYVSTTTCMTPSMKKEKLMLNVLLPERKSAIPRHTNTSEVIVCIYGSAIELFYDEQGNDIEMVNFQIDEYYV